MSERKRVATTPDIFSTRESSRAQHFAWVAGGDDIFGDVVGDDGAGTDDAARADGHPGKNKRARADESVFVDRNLCNGEGHV